MKGIVRNYRKELKRRRNKEISYCELPEIVVEKLAVWDEYESDYTAFDVCGIEVTVDVSQGQDSKGVVWLLLIRKR